MSFRNDYETLYGISLLDDLHNYFPALLYDSSQFSNAQQVLSYIQQQTRRRFDLYSHGLEGYRQRSRTPFRSNATYTHTFPVYVAPSAPAAAGIDEDDEEEETIQFNIPLPQPRTPPPTVRAAPSTAAQNALNMERWILNSLQPNRAMDATTRLLMASLTGLLPQRGDPDFMQPVIVRPTREQIQANTSVSLVEEASADNCAICQDSFTAGTSQRTIHACHHRFHTHCIDTWFQQNVHCPVCRHDIRESPPS